MEDSDLGEGKMVGEVGAGVVIGDRRTGRGSDHVFLTKQQAIDLATWLNEAITEWREADVED